MAKKTARMLVGLRCSECKKLNYVTQKNKLNDAKLEPQNKYCNKCKKVTSHTEVAKLK